MPVRSRRPSRNLRRKPAPDKDDEFPRPGRVSFNEFVTNVTSDSRPYLSYVALLTQNGTNAPVSTVLENTLGGTVVWSYEGAGVYSATLVGAFLETTTFLLHGGNPNSNAEILFHRVSDDVIRANSFSGYGGVGGNNLITGDSFEIRVYGVSVPPPPTTHHLIGLLSPITYAN